MSMHLAQSQDVQCSSSRVQDNLAGGIVYCVPTYSDKNCAVYTERLGEEIVAF